MDRDLRKIVDDLGKFLQLVKIGTAYLPAFQLLDGVYRDMVAEGPLPPYMIFVPSFTASPNGARNVF